jgi:hypothetical protein
MKKLLISILFVSIGIQSLKANAQVISAFGDLLVWHVSEQTAATWANIVSKPQSNTVDFDAANIEFNWDVGFRGGVLFSPNKDTQDVAAYWTYFPSRSSSNFRLSEQIVVPDFFSGFVSEDLFFGANINWRIIMNMFDLEIARKINIGHGVSICPAIGIKSGTIKQSINTEWDALVYTASENVKHNYFGVGPTFSIDTNWNVYKNINLIGDFATAFMWGYWQISDTYTRPPALFGIVTPTTITTNMNQMRLGTAMFDYFMGLEWAHQGKLNINLQLGYEMQLWTNQLRMPTFQQLPVHGNLTLQGATCHIRIDL